MLWRGTQIPLITGLGLVTSFMVYSKLKHDNEKRYSTYWCQVTAVKSPCKVSRYLKYTCKNLQVESFHYYFPDYRYRKPLIRDQKNPTKIGVKWDVGSHDRYTVHRYIAHYLQNAVSRGVGLCRGWSPMRDSTLYAKTDFRPPWQCSSLWSFRLILGNQIGYLLQ